MFQTTTQSFFVGWIWMGDYFGIKLLWGCSWGLDGEFWHLLQDWIGDLGGGFHGIHVVGKNCEISQLRTSGYIIVQMSILRENGSCGAIVEGFFPSDQWPWMQLGWPQILQ